MVTTLLVISAGAAIGGWSFLRLLGGEQQRRTQLRDLETAAAIAAASSPASGASASAHKAAAGRHSVR